MGHNRDDGITLFAASGSCTQPSTELATHTSKKMADALVLDPVGFNKGLVSKSLLLRMSSHHLGVLQNDNFLVVSHLLDNLFLL